MSDDIAAEIALPSRRVPLDSDFPPEQSGMFNNTLAPVYADKFGRLWVWWQDTKQLIMVFDPREARG